MITKAIEYVYTYLGIVRDHLSAEWRRGANMRTVLAAFIIGFISLATYTQWILPPEDFPLGTLVEIPQGETLETLSQLLESQRVVRSNLALQLLINALGKSTEVKAGDYVFKEPATVFRVAQIITTGAFGLEPERIRIHEGATTKEMAEMFASRLQRVNADDFYAKAKPYEGFLFPDTYYFLPNASADVIVSAMRDNFDQQIQTLTGEIASFGRPLYDVLIMASIIEREARISKDRRMISGVLWNRIEKDMLLQVDAAFLYTMGKATFDLTIADLKADDPYNTYKYKGLPPTPIGSPSLDSIRAAVTPEKHSYLFYLADNHGTTYYSKTYDEHLRKKRLYLGS